MAQAQPAGGRRKPRASGKVASPPHGGKRLHMTAVTLAQLLLLAGALAAALVLRPWRMLRGGSGLSTPLLAALTLLPWIWAWPHSAAMPIPLQWSGAALAVLMLGWPLAVPVLVTAGISTMFTAGASWADALATTIWLGLLPATLVLLLGHAVRKAFGTHPAVYLLGRAFAVPLLALFGCMLGSAFAGQALAGEDSETLVVAALLMAMAETIWTCAVASVLVAWRPQWLATWSDALYLGSRRPA
jgi:hypothetical protein